MDVGAASDGRIAVAASAISDTGQSISVLAWLDPSGKIERLVRTSPFSARRIGFANDGTLWAAGWVYDAAHNQAEQYDVLRQYDRQGKLIRTALPKSAISRSRDSLPVDYARLAVGDDRILLVSMASRSLVEISFDGEIIGKWSLPDLMGGQMLTGAAATSKGAFISIQGAPVIGPTSQRSVATEIYRLDPKANQFVRVDTSKMKAAEQTVQLMGRDGDRLVVRLKPFNSIKWLNLAD